MWQEQKSFASTYFIGDKEKSYFIEAVPGKIAVADVSDASYSVCTNHGQLLFDEGCQSGPVREWSENRLKVAKNKLQQAKSLNDVKKMLACHEGGKDSICGHGAIYTQSSYIFCPQEMYGEILIGTPPCQGTYQKVLWPTANDF